MEIQQNISLKKYNTFGVDVTAKRFISIEYTHQLQDLLKQEQELFIISGGSNMLLTRNIEELVVHLNTKGISIDHEDENSVYLTVNAGENWHSFVVWCISLNYGGIENLSLIPGNVGTCPIQNIGAYGVEVRDVITKVNAVEIKTGKQVSFTNKECEFGYRNSIFKTKAKGQYIITSVSFKLSKKGYQTNTSYGAIEKELSNRNIKNPTIKEVSDAVIAIRQSKLPDPKEIGNSGSFFKNPVIPASNYDKLLIDFPLMPHYSVSETLVKIPAGWLIEQSGFKGKNFGNYGVHDKQALVLVNYGKASGKDIFELAQLIQKTVYEKFAIQLEIEVNVI